MMKKSILISIVTMFFMTSCATVFTGTKDTIKFDTDPQGAEIYIDGLEVCTTPCTSQIKRSLSDKLVEIKLDGYETRVITLDREFNAVSIINLGFLLGWGIDAATGALMKYDRKGYDLELDPESSASLINTTKIELDTKQKVANFYVIQSSGN